MKLKRRLCYKEHYIYQYTGPAMQPFCGITHLYKDVEVKSNWLSDDAQDNDLLL